MLAHSLALEGGVTEGIGYALWLHVGTAPSAVVAFRSESAGILRGLFERPTKPSPLAAFLLMSTLISGVVGLPLLLLLTEISEGLGSAAMAVVGVALLVTGALQLRRPSAGVRARGDLSGADWLLAGVSQGLSVVPRPEQVGPDGVCAAVAQTSTGARRWWSAS